jgi:DNA replicative helicase MCM subunit Mcm2 (Cdc46/Mcm family)
LDLITSDNGPLGSAIEDIIAMAATRGVPQEAVLAAIESLITDDECYQPRKGFIKLL